MGLIDYYASVRNGHRRARWPWVAAALVAALAGSWMLLGKLPGLASAPTTRQMYFTVARSSLDIVIRQDGELQSLNNIDINCPVEGQNTIQQIVPEGTFVKQGDVIAVLDSTEHARRLETAEIELEKADADVKWAKEQKSIQEVKNAADLEAANSELSLARLDLREYTDGAYPASVKEAQRKLEMANISLKKKEEELGTSKKLLDRGFVTMSDVQKAELEVVTARNEQEKASTDLRVLTEYKHAREEAEKQNKVTQAENKVARVRNENASNLAQKVSDLNTKERQLSMRKAAAERARKQFESCTITAPADGMVLYASSVSQRYVFNEQPIQVGAKVMQEQMIVRLPDVSKMKAVVKIPEARVTRLRMRDESQTIRAEVSIVGVPRPIGATLSKVGVLPDNSQRWWNPEAKDYPVDLTLDETPSGLKPGATASVTISVGKLQDVLTVPLGAIYSVGSDHYVFVRDLPRAQPRKIDLGQSNETMVEVVDGLTAGQEVLLLGAGQGRELLDLAGIKTTAPTTAPSSLPPGPAQASRDRTVS